MNFVFSVLGGVVCAIGIVLAAAGLIDIVPAAAFSLGGTLLIIGIVMLVGGFILTGLGTSNRQLRRIAYALERLTAALEAEQLLPPDRPRVPAAAGEADEEDPGPPPFAVHPQPPEPVAAGSVRRLDEPQAPVPTAGKEPLVVPPPAGMAEPAPQKSIFDSIWLRGSQGAGEGGAARPEAAPEVRPPAAPPATSAPAVRSPVETPSPAPATAPVPPPAKPDGASPVTAGPGEPGKAPASTVFRSGVIDGMAYTLYTDGSIDAELPQGKLRFGSIEELRAYLADHA